jgi:hypothetical protein
MGIPLEMSNSLGLGPNFMTAKRGQNPRRPDLANRVDGKTLGSDPNFPSMAQILQQYGAEPSHHFIPDTLCS